MFNSGLMSYSNFRESAISMGVPRDQVNLAWFSEEHTKALETGLPFETIKGLNWAQVKAMRITGEKDRIKFENKPLEQEHLEALEKGISIDIVTACNVSQARGLIIGFTLQDVRATWFSSNHLNYTLPRGRFTVEEVRGLDNLQCGFLEWGIPKKIILENALTNTHLILLKKGYTIEALLELNDNQLNALTTGISLEQIKKCKTNRLLEVAKLGLDVDEFIGISEEKLSLVSLGIKEPLLLRQLSDYQVAMITENQIPYEVVKLFPPDFRPKNIGLFKHAINTVAYSNNKESIKELFGFSEAQLDLVVMRYEVAFVQSLTDEECKVLRRSSLSFENVKRIKKDIKDINLLSADLKRLGLQYQALEKGWPLEQTSQLSTVQLNALIYSDADLEEAKQLINGMQESGLKNGFSIKEVLHRNYCGSSIPLVQKGFKVTEVLELSPLQQEVLYTRTDRTFAFEKLKQLQPHQLTALTLPCKLAIEEVTQSWFSPMHTLALDTGLPYSAIEKKSGEEVFSLLCTPLNSSSLKAEVNKTEQSSALLLQFQSMSNENAGLTKSRVSEQRLADSIQP